REPEDADRSLDHVRKHGHVRPEAEVLEDHGELAAGMRRNWYRSLARSMPSRSRTVASTSPSMATVPALGRSRKLMQCRNVLLPEPLAPITLITSPASAWSETPFSTSCAP